MNAVVVASVVGGVAAILGLTFCLARAAEAAALPGWAARDWRAFIALWASIFGAAAMTFFAAWIVWIIWQGAWPVETAPRRIDQLGKAMIISLVGSLVVLFSLGFAINRRAVRATRSGIEVTGGDDDDAPPVAKVTTETRVTVPANPTDPVEPREAI